VVDETGYKKFLYHSSRHFKLKLSVSGPLPTFRFIFALYGLNRSVLGLRRLSRPLYGLKTMSNLGEKVGKLSKKSMMERSPCRESNSWIFRLTAILKFLRHPQDLMQNSKFKWFGIVNLCN
jgi:hypothetical protein